MRSLKVLSVVELLASVVPLLELLRSEYPTNSWIDRREGRFTKENELWPHSPKLSSRKEGQYNAVVEDGRVRYSM